MRQSKRALFFVLTNDVGTGMLLGFGQTKAGPMGTRFRRISCLFGRWGLAQVGLQNAAPAGVLESANGFLFDLTNTFTGQIKTLTNFLEGQGMLSSESKVQANYVGLTACQRLQTALNFLSQRLGDEHRVRRRGVVGLKHVVHRA